MAKIRNPKSFSAHFEVQKADLNRLGVLDSTLNVDVRLFIDPLLLEKSRHPEMSQDARLTYEKHFTTVIKFLQKTRAPCDVAWRSAQRLLFFPEIKWTCLGYGAQSVSGSGSGAHMTRQFINTAQQIVQLGVDDPDLFVSMALFEQGVGPDRISDMTTNVIFGDLIKFNERVLKELNIPTRPRRVRLRNGRAFNATLPDNPFIRNGGPVVLVPSDILRHLPIVTDWTDVMDAVSKNQELRNRVNLDIAEIWEAKSREGKRRLRDWALSGEDEFRTFLDMIRDVDAKPYDIESDPLGELSWRRIIDTLAHQHPLRINQPAPLDVDYVDNVVTQIIDQFRFLVEGKGLWKELYHDGKPRKEMSAQRLFFAVSYAYCKANDLDLTPEAETGNGPVDFKVSSGFEGRVLVEIKLSRNNKLVSGYTKQLQIYRTAEETLKAYYLVIDIGGMGMKEEKLMAARNEVVSGGNPAPEIIVVDGNPKPSASKS